MLKDAKIDKESFKMGLLIVVILMLLVNNFFNIKDSDKIDYLKDEIKKVNINIEQVYKENKQLKNQISDFKDEISNIDRGVSINNNKIENLKIYEKKQTNSFATYGNSEWEKYFADRYKK